MIVIKTHRCPVCHKIFQEEKYMPFCSKRCADVDLANWFNGSYAVPLVEPDEADQEILTEALINAEETEQ